MPSVLRALAKKLLLATPLEPLARWSDRILTGNKNYLYDRQTFEVMRRVLKTDSCFVDVGCHKGGILREALQLAPNGQHWAFEPIPELAASLRRGFPTVKVLEVAVADHAGQGEFAFVRSAPALSGIQLRPSARREQVLTIPVSFDTLDNIVADSRVDMIKIDVEGAELLVLRGGVKSISKNKPVIVFEHGLGGADAYGHTPEKVFDVLSSCGLAVSTMKCWLRAQAFFSRSQFCDHFYSGADYYFIAGTR